MTLAASSVLHYWSARYGAIATVGGKPTFSRNSAGRWVDQQGILQSAIVNTPRSEWATIASERRQVMRLERAGTNLCLQSENFGTTWVAQASVTRVAAAHTVSGVTLDLITATVGSGDYYYQAVTFTGNATKNVSVYFKKGTNAATRWMFAFFDNTAAVFRMRARIQWTGAVPSIQALIDGGTNAVIDGPLLGDVYRLSVNVPGVVAANVNRIQVRPVSDDLAATGDLYAGGVQAEDATGASSYAKTTTATITRSVDQFYWDFMPAPQALMLYGRAVLREDWDTANDTLGGISSATSAYLHVYRSNAGGCQVEHHNGTSNVVSDIAFDAAVGDVMEWVAVLKSDGKVTSIASVNAGAASAGTESGALALAANWGAKQFWLNSHGANDPRLADYAEIKIVKYADVAGVTTADIMAELRAFEVSPAGEVINAGS